MPSRSERNAISPSGLRGDSRVEMIGTGNVAVGMGVMVGARVGVWVGAAVGIAVAKVGAAKKEVWGPGEQAARIKKLANVMTLRFFKHFVKFIKAG